MSNSSNGDAGLDVNSTTPRTEEASLAQYPEYQAALIIWSIFPPGIILLGGFGNVATFFVMRRIKDHNSSQHAVFMALAVSDFTLMCTDTVYEWLRNSFEIDLRSLHNVPCKLLFWMVYVSGTMSAWLVTCVTVQRTMAVLWPHRMQVMCTVRRTWIVIATLFFAACAVDSHLLFGMEISAENQCQTVPGYYRYFYVIVFSWVHSCIASLFPSVCLFVCDIILAVTLFRAVSSSSSMSAHSDSSGSAVHNTESRQKISYRTTVMVLAISCAFLVLTLPVCVYFIWSSFIYQVIKRHPLTIPVVNLIYAITHQLWYLNSAINFYLYCLTGTKFRREFMNWICCGSASSVRETAPGVSKRKEKG